MFYFSYSQIENVPDQEKREKLKNKQKLSELSLVFGK